jgi:hypothetical protein
VWLRDLLRRKPQWLLRLGRQQVTLWRQSGRTWVHVGAAPVGAMGAGAGWATGALGNALNDLMAAHQIDGGSAQFVIDSCWLPAFALQTGRLPLSEAELQSLARLRLTQIHGDVAIAWRIQVSCRAGNTFGLAYACPTWLKDIIGSATTAHQLELSGLHPTLDWLLAQAPRAASRPAQRAVNILEEDRFITTFWHGRHLTGMHPNVQPGSAQEPPDEQCLQVIAKRCQARLTGPVDSLSTVNLAWWEPKLDKLKHKKQWTLLGIGDPGADR